MTSGVRACRRLRVTGVVQGVGFRPFVHRLATELHLDGIVGNDTTSVFIEVEGPRSRLDRFTARLRSEAPPLAIVEGVEATDAVPSSRRGFSIVDSRPGAGAVTVVPPDMAVCDACVAELWDPTNRRYLHPFITCTDCGPRFTITRRLPYDRPDTTMADFPLCPACRAEYLDPHDRRFHAQPIGCHHCGPTLRLRLGTDPVRAGAEAWKTAQSALAGGAILAVKGLGGYHLVCDARADEALSSLRRRKGRADKPFAVMTADLSGAARLGDLSADDERLLVSPARPIVLVPARPDSPLSPVVAPGNPLIGLMLAYTPLHHLLLNRRESDGRITALGPLVVTSSNRSGEPICYRDDDLAERLGDLVDGVLSHDRPIHVPCDDSVVRVNGGRLLPLRRSRGYAPLPVRIPSTARHILAVGAEMKNAFCVGSGERAWMSQHIGDMGNLATLEAFEASVHQFCDLYQISPAVVAVDAHPGYLSSRWARTHHPGAVVEVQHHHAHVASVMAEHHLSPDEPVIGVAFDGTGYGDDGTIWGGELLEATAARYHRLGHLAPIPLPGGDAAIRHPWRVALAHLTSAGIGWDGDLAPVGQASRTELDVLDRQLTSGLACVPTTSMGRLFDGVSSLLGLRHHATYEAQAAIDLEHCAARFRGDPSRLAFSLSAEGVADAAPLIAGIINGLRSDVSVGALAAGFHVAVIDVVSAWAELSRSRTGSRIVVLSGGVWQNALLAGLAQDRLAAAGFDVRTNRLVPPNDGGLALGQLFIAAHRGR